MSYPVFYPIKDDVLPVLFNSFDSAGGSVTLTGLAVTDIEIYKDGGTTQRASDAGYTLLDTDGIDFDTLTGIHGFSIDLSDNTDAGFYAVGPWYHVVVSSVTIDGETVSFVAAAFRILDATRGMAGTALPDAAADAAGGLPISDAGGLDLDTQIGTDIDAILVDTNELQGDWVNGGRLDLILDELTTQGDTNEGKLDTIDTVVDAILVDTIEIGAAGAGLTEAGGTGDQFTGLPEVSADVVKISGSTDAADRLEDSSETIVYDTVNGAGGTTTSVPGGGTASLDATDDHYNGCIMIFKSGVLQNQRTEVTDYDGATNTFTVVALTEAPGDGDQYILV
jgi:hypothetical protein